MNLDLEALNGFVKVAEVGSFTQAAAQLGVPKARLSQMVRRLEDSVDGKLLHRTTRVVRITPDGEHFLERARSLLLDAEALGGMFSGALALAGRVRVDLPAGFSTRVVIPRLPELLKKYPQLELQLSSTDRLVDVVREGFDCVVRVAALADSNLMSTRLGELEVVNCASPGYLKEHGIPRTLAALDSHFVVHYSASLGSSLPEFDYFDGKSYRSRPMKARLTVNSSDSYLSAALAGMGIIQAPIVGARSALDRGELIEVLPSLRAAPLPVYLLHPHGRMVPPRIRVVLDWIEKIMREDLRTTRRTSKSGKTPKRK
jgi:DNA-binding transcriptional LysR family regulator